MKICCWNIRGFIKPLKQKCVQSLIKTHNLDIVCLLETKLELEALNKIQLRFNGMSFLQNFSSSKIRFLLLWNANVANVTLIDMNDQFMHVKIECNQTSVSFFITFVYGLHSRNERKSLWESLIRLGTI